MNADLTLPFWRLASLPIIFAALLVLIAVPGSAQAKRCSAQNAAPGSFAEAKAEKAVLCLLNKQRKKAGAPKLSRHNSLDKPAREHSKLMVDSGCFEHQCPGEDDLGDRLSAYLAGGGGGFGENIAYGGGDLGAPKSIVNSWMKSEGHRRNILDEDFVHIGIGVVWGNPLREGSDAGTYTTDFGFRSN